MNKLPKEPVLPLTFRPRATNNFFLVPPMDFSVLVTNPSTIYLPYNKHVDEDGYYLISVVNSPTFCMTVSFQAILLIAWL